MLSRVNNKNNINPRIYLLREDKLNTDSESRLLYTDINEMKKLILDSLKANNDPVSDFIFICYFLGNDFLPKIPSLNIYNGAIDMIVNIYNSKVDPGIISIDNNDNFNITFRLEEFIHDLAMNEDTMIKANIINKNKSYNYLKRINDEYEKELFIHENILFDVNDPIKLYTANYKKRYYHHYWNLDNDDIEDFIKTLVKEYIYGLRWIAYYYFDTCCSWSWFYPHDYAPFISDIYKYMNIYDINEVKFDLFKPIEPLLQLLIVLPYNSFYLLPNCFHDRLTNPDDNEMSILHLYPTEFKQDLLNKRQFWMGIPIIPQLDFDKIRRYYNVVKKSLSDKDIQRNGRK